MESACRYETPTPFLLQRVTSEMSASLTDVGCAHGPQGKGKPGSLSQERRVRCGCRAAGMEAQHARARRDTLRKQGCIGAARSGGRTAGGSEPPTPPHARAHTRVPCAGAGSPGPSSLCTTFGGPPPSRPTRPAPQPMRCVLPRPRRGATAAHALRAALAPRPARAPRPVRPDRKSASASSPRSCRPRRSATHDPSPQLSPPALGDPPAPPPPSARRPIPARAGRREARAAATARIRDRHAGSPAPSRGRRSSKARAARPRAPAGAAAGAATSTCAATTPARRDARRREGRAP